MFIFGCQNASNNNQQSENKRLSNQEKHEHAFNEYKMDSEYHWYECEKDDCQYLTAPEEHDFGEYRHIQREEGNVDKETRVYVSCVICGYQMDLLILSPGPYSGYHDWIRFKVIGFDLETTLMSYELIQECLMRNISLEELQNEYAVLKIVVLEDFNQYIYHNNYSTDLRKMMLKYNIDNGIYTLMIIPRSQLRHYILYEEYITQFYDITYAYDEEFWRNNIENDPYIGLPKYTCCDRYMQVIYNIYNSPNFFAYFTETKVNAIPICDGKIDFSRYTEEQLEDFFDFSNPKIDNDTIIRYLTHYPNKENEFSFDFTLEEIREWITKFSKYVYDKYHNK